MQRVGMLVFYGLALSQGIRAFWKHRRRRAGLGPFQVQMKFHFAWTSDIIPGDLVTDHAPPHATEAFLIISSRRQKRGDTEFFCFKLGEGLCQTTVSLNYEGFWLLDDETT